MSNEEKRYYLADELEALEMFHSPQLDIHDFHMRFGFKQPEKPQFLDDEHMAVRLNFLLEELLESAAAAGFVFISGDDQEGMKPHFRRDFMLKRNLAEFLDGMVDLEYVQLGTAWLMNLPIAQAWNRVHSKNMQKVRAERADQSKRGTAFDVIKPEGWTPPVHDDLLD